MPFATPALSSVEILPLPLLMTLNGVPDWMTVMPENCQPSASIRSNREGAEDVVCSWLGPNGLSIQLWILVLRFGYVYM